jgi:hypothetical protein
MLKNEKAARAEISICIGLKNIPHEGRGYGVP